MSRRKATTLRRAKTQKRMRELVSEMRKREPRSTILDPVEKVAWCGTGFLRIRYAALVKLWARARPYRDEGTGLRAVFAYKFDGQMVSEDVFMCGNWRGMGGKVFVDTKIHLGHVGPKVYMIGG